MGADSAEDAGIAEADPTGDLSGMDAAVKVVALAAALAKSMSDLSAVVAEPAEKLREGHQRLVERRATLETELAATAAQSAALHGRLSGLQQTLDQVVSRVESTQQLAQSLEAGQPVSEAAQHALQAPD